MKFKYKSQRVMRLQDCKPGYKYKLEPTHICDNLIALWIMNDKIYWDASKYPDGRKYHIPPNHCGTFFSSRQARIAFNMHFVVTNIYRRKKHAN